MATARPRGAAATWYRSITSRKGAVNDVQGRRQPGEACKTRWTHQAMAHSLGTKPDVASAPCSFGYYFSNHDAGITLSSSRSMSA